MFFLRRVVLLVLVSALVGAAGFYGARFVTATGPTQPAGVGSGAIATDGSNNVSIGTTTFPNSNVKLYVVGSGTATTTLRVYGRIESATGTIPGGFVFPDGTIQTTAGGGSTVSAANVSSGAFGANTGGGNYSFPASVGVGTTTPSYRLDVQQGSTGILPGINIIETNTTNRRATLGFGLNAAATTGWIMGQSSGNNTTKDFYLYDVTAGVNRLVINTSGNVGIGMSTPSEELEIQAADVGFRLLDSGAGNPVAEITDLSAAAGTINGRLSLYSGTTENVRISAWAGENSWINAGNVGIGTASPGAKLQIGDTGGSGRMLRVRSDLADSVIGSIVNAGNTSEIFIFRESSGHGLLHARNSSNATTIQLSAAGSSYFTGGNVGIGTSTPGTTLDINGTGRANGGFAASGYTATGWTGVNAEVGVTGASAYFTGYNRTSSAYVDTYVRGANVFLQSNGTTRLTVGTDGLITVTNRITGVSTPTGSSDAATKGYVDSVVGVQYMGRTVTTYNGNLGGIGGANAKCNTAFAGSHMCTQGEALRSGATSFGGDGWVSCDLYVSDGGAQICSGVSYSIYHASASQSCAGWANSGTGASGPVMASAGSVFGPITCDNSRSIHCCK